MDIRFDGKTTIVTGSSRGIGYACAELMAESGSNVAIIGSNPETLIQAEMKLKQKGNVKGFPLDLSNIPGISEVVKKIREEMGEIDVLIQSAGLMRGGPAENITGDEWDEVMNVNAKALFFMMQAVAKQSMIPRESGSIVNISSIAGIRGMKEPLCSSHYSSSKGAVVRLPGRQQ